MYTVYQSNEDGFIGLYTGDWTDVPRLTTLLVLTDFDEARACLKEALSAPKRHERQCYHEYAMRNRELREQGKPVVGIEKYAEVYREYLAAHPIVYVSRRYSSAAE